MREAKTSVVLLLDRGWKVASGFNSAVRDLGKKVQSLQRNPSPNEFLWDYEDSDGGYFHDTLFNCLRYAESKKD